MSLETPTELATLLADARRQIASLSAANDALTRTYALVNGGVMRERDEALAQLAAARAEIERLRAALRREWVEGGSEEARAAAEVGRG